MAFKSTKKSRERICAFGAVGGGKSHQFLRTIKRQVKSGSTARGYVISTDRAYERMIESDEFAVILKADALEYENVKDWDQSLKVLNRYLGVVKPDDWISVDLAGPVWNYVQEAYVQGVHGKDKSEWLVEIAKDVAAGQGDKHKTKRGGFEGRSQWGTINAMWADFSIPLLVEAECHVLDRKSTRLNSSHIQKSRMPSSA